MIWFYSGKFNLASRLDYIYFFRRLSFLSTRTASALRTFLTFMSFDWRLGESQWLFSNSKQPLMWMSSSVFKMSTSNGSQHARENSMLIHSFYHNILCLTSYLQSTKLLADHLTFFYCIFFYFGKINYWNWNWIEFQLTRHKTVPAFIYKKYANSLTNRGKTPKETTKSYALMNAVCVQ